MNISLSEQNNIIKSYQDGLNMKQVAKKYNINFNRVRYTLSKNKIPGRKQHFDYDLNHNYFNEIDLEEKAYFLGFLYADGYTDGIKRVSLELAEEDKYILYKLAKQIYKKNKYPIYHCPKSKQQDTYHLQIISNKISQDLVKWGCIPNKTHNLIELPPISQNLLPHFIRGYFDGDGSIYISYAKHKTAKNKRFLRSEIAICCTPKFGSNLELYLNNLGIKTDIKICNNTNVIIVLRIRTNLQVKKFLNLIYNDAIYFLKRKHKKYKLFLKEHSKIRPQKEWS